MNRRVRLTYRWAACHLGFHGDGLIEAGPARECLRCRHAWLRVIRTRSHPGTALPVRWTAQEWKRVR